MPVLVLTTRRLVVAVAFLVTAAATVAAVASATTYVPTKGHRCKAGYVQKTVIKREHKGKGKHRHVVKVKVRECVSKPKPVTKPAPVTTIATTAATTATTTTTPPVATPPTTTVPVATPAPVATTTTVTASVVAESICSAEFDFALFGTPAGGGTCYTLSGSTVAAGGSTVPGTATLTMGDNDCSAGCDSTFPFRLASPATVFVGNDELFATASDTVGWTNGQMIETFGSPPYTVTASYLGATGYLDSTSATVTLAP
jgi:hypothetical protein